MNYSEVVTASTALHSWCCAKATKADQITNAELEEGVTLMLNHLGGHKAWQTGCCIVLLLKQNSSSMFFNI